MIGVKTKDTHFEQGLREIKAYIAQYGTIQDLSRDYHAPSGFALGAFVYLEIYNYKNCNPRMAQRIEPLQEAGLDWEQAANWEYRMRLIIQAYQEQGKLPETLIYRGENLMDWFQEQVRLYETDIDKLGYSQVKMLSMVGGCPGLTLDEYRERRWDMLCAQMQQYRKADGTPDLEKLEQNESLEKWYKKQLKAFRDDKLTPRRAKKLAAVGMTKKYMLHTVEEKHRTISTFYYSWESYYQELVQYREKFQNVNVPRGYASKYGMKLGRWLYVQKSLMRSGKLDPEKAEKLVSIGVVQTTEGEQSWRKKYRACKVYYQQHHNLDVSLDYVDENGISIGKWLHMQREGYQTGKISPERINLLNQIGMVW